MLTNTPQWNYYLLRICFKSVPLIVFLLVCASSAVLAQSKQKKTPKKLPLQTTSTSSVPATLREISEKLRVKKGLQVQFKQNVLTIRKKIRKTSGNGFFHPDGRFRWIVSHRGQTVRIFIYDSKSLTEHIPTEKVANIWSITGNKTLEINRVVSMIRSLDNLLRDYKVKETQETTKSLNLVLLPKSKGDISKVNLTIDLDRNFISKVKIFYQKGRYNEFIFHNPIRKTLNAKYFKFTPSQKTKVNYID